MPRIPFFKSFHKKSCRAALLNPKHISDDLFVTSWHQNKELPLARLKVLDQAPFMLTHFGFSLVCAMKFFLDRQPHLSRLHSSFARRFAVIIVFGTLPVPVRVQLSANLSKTAISERKFRATANKSQECFSSRVHEVERREASRGEGA